jgi:hypothetical protein
MSRCSFRTHTCTFFYLQLGLIGMAAPINLSDWRNPINNLHLHHFPLFFFCLLSMVGKPHILAYHWLMPHRLAKAFWSTLVYVCFNFFYSISVRVLMSAILIKMSCFLFSLHLLFHFILFVLLTRPFLYVLHAEFLMAITDNVWFVWLGEGE